MRPEAAGEMDDAADLERDSQWWRTSALTYRIPLPCPTPDFESSPSPGYSGPQCDSCCFSYSETVAQNSHLVSQPSPIYSLSCPSSAPLFLPTRVLRTWAVIAPALVTDILKKLAPLLPDDRGLLQASFYLRAHQVHCFSKPYTRTSTWALPIVSSSLHRSSYQPTLYLVHPRSILVTATSTTIVTIFTL